MRLRKARDFGRWEYALYTPPTILEFVRFKEPRVYRIGDYTMAVSHQTVVRNATDSEIKEDIRKDERTVRKMVSGKSLRHLEWDYTGVRYKLRDHDDERMFRDEYPDLKIKFRKKRIIR